MHHYKGRFQSRVFQVFGAALVLSCAAGIVSADDPTILAASATGPRTWQVANNGQDNPTCGSVQQPCRSISQAIAIAHEGDSIVVGPGRYGDLNANGVLGEPGEEIPDLSVGAMINVTKRLQVRSRDGAARTILDVNGAAKTAVRIAAGGSIFGVANGGFTATRAVEVAFVVEAPPTVTLRANVARESGGGFFLRHRNHKLIGNTAIENTENGFLLFGSGHLLDSNIAAYNRGVGQVQTQVGGFYVIVDIGNVGHRIRNNFATGNDYGFIIAGVVDTVLVQNSAIGNRGPGLFIVGGPTNTLTIARNNFYGNNDQSFPGAGLNCGLLNVATELVIAVNNFWGASTGPGDDPADQVCGDSPTRTTPFATEEFRF